jgi:hypothetical protein
MLTCILVAWGSLSVGFLLGTMWFGLFDHTTTPTHSAPRGQPYVPHHPYAS